MIAIPAPAWVVMALAIVGVIYWIFDLLVVKPKRHRERMARKRSL